jgi:hypothetical protein
MILFDYQSTFDAVYVYVVPWSKFPIIPCYPHYPQGGVWGEETIKSEGLQVCDLRFVVEGSDLSGRDSARAEYA